MTPARDGPIDSIPADGYPDPVLVYDLSNDVTEVCGVNDRFQAVFGPVTPGTTLDRAFEDAGLSPIDGGDLAARLRDETRFELIADTGGRPGRRRYVATVAADGEGGHLVFARIPTGDRSTLGVDHMASVVSHELRNPLEVAKTRLQVGRETGDDDHFRHVAAAHDRMERIIEDVLTLTRGEDAIEPRDTVDLTAVAEAAWDAVDTDDATLVVEAPLPTAVADVDRTRRLFENLFRNAVEHATENGCDPDGRSDGERAGSDRGVEVRIGPLDDEVMGFYVEDDGPGIPPADRERVFEPGYSTHDHGTGLGLAIVDRIVEGHGWGVEIRDGRDGGARIEVRGT